MSHNAGDFLICFQKARANYNVHYKKKIDELRNILAQNPSGEAPPDADNALEFHLREYLVNEFLRALNWQTTFSPDDMLNLFLESPVKSSFNGRTCFLDYLGIEREGQKPLLIVETKRPNSLLPKKDNQNISSLIIKGLGGEDIGYEWRKWLDQLRKYVQAIKERTGIFPKRVVITNMEWLILFVKPEDSFCNTHESDPNKILVYEKWDDIEQKYNQVFYYLEYQHILKEAPPLSASEIPFYVKPDEISSIMFGLRLLYISVKGFNEHSPHIKIMPVIFLRLINGTWLRIDSHREEEIPKDYKEIPDHLKNIKEIFDSLLSDINRRLCRNFHPDPLTIHYNDEERFKKLKGVMKKGYWEVDHAFEFIILTGDNTHYILQQPIACTYHDWVKSDKKGCASNPGPIFKRSMENRSFFISGEVYHCAHRDVYEAKACQINPNNCDRCGLRSGSDYDAFCEIWQFEKHLCCKMCVFGHICTNTKLFILPC